jgi:Berberine and berberine like
VRASTTTDFPPRCGRRRSSLLEIGPVLAQQAQLVPYAATVPPHAVSTVGLGSSERGFYDHWDELRPHLDGLYLSFETDERPERLEDAFPGDTLTRLRRLKARYDPDNVFNQNFPISPAADDDEACAPSFSAPISAKVT